MRDPAGALRKCLEKEFPRLASELEVVKGLEGSDADPERDDDEEDVEGRHSVRLRRAPPGFGLFDYQEELASGALAVLARQVSHSRALLALPTGGGKTRTALAAVLSLFEQSGARTVLWLAPTKELLFQAADSAESLWRANPALPDLDIVIGDRVDPESPSQILLWTPQLLASRMRAGSGRPKVDAVVFDEAHHMAAATYRRAVEWVCAEDPSLPVLGLSATPGRRQADETESLVDLFGKKLLVSRLLQPNAVDVLRARGVLSQVVFRIAAEAPTVAGSQELARFRGMIALCLRLGRAGDRVLTFTESIQHARLLAACLRDRGLASMSVSSYSTAFARSAALEAFRVGRVLVLCNKALLGTGYDCPAVKHVVLGATIRSPILFEQIVGRASRGPAVGGSSVSTVWSFEDHLRLHGRPASYHRFEEFQWESTTDI